MTTTTTRTTDPSGAVVTPAVFSHAPADQPATRPTSSEHAYPVWISAPADRPRR